MFRISSVHLEECSMLLALPQVGCHDAGTIQPCCCETLITTIVVIVLSEPISVYILPDRQFRAASLQYIMDFASSEPGLSSAPCAWSWRRLFVSFLSGATCDIAPFRHMAIDWCGMGCYTDVIASFRTFQTPHYSGQASTHADEVTVFCVVHAMHYRFLELLSQGL
jgi:hypothetical protein